MLNAFCLLAAVATLAASIGVLSIWHGVSFRSYVRREMRSSSAAYTPFTSVFLPCKGIDRRLSETLSRIRNQDFPAYEVICAVESAHDPALGPIEAEAARPGRAPLRWVIAERAESCSQKINNLLAAIPYASPESRVYAFLDSDAVPHDRWLTSIVAPLANQDVGAATGYRWYVPGRSVAAKLRCVWNAGHISLLGGHRFNFVWGGSVAVRRAAFETLDIARRWAAVLSEDFEITRAVRTAGMRVHFVPRCVIPNDDDSTWRSFWSFARRQFIITRLCHPPVWIIGALIAVLHTAGFWSMFAYGVFWMMTGTGALAVLAWGLFIVQYGLSIAKGLLRQQAIALVVPDAAQRRGAVAWDAFGGPLVMLLNLALMIATGVSNRFWWRGVRYQMEAIDHVRVLDRLDAMDQPVTATRSAEPFAAS